MVGSLGAMGNRRVAFVTGAGRGIGRALALGFGREGYVVVAGSTTAARNQAVAQEIKAEGGEALAVELDVSQEDSVRWAVDQALLRYARVDVLINNAALLGTFIPTDRRHVKDLPADVWRRMLDVNVTGALLCSQACASAMMDQRAGSIINVSSSAATQFRETESFYGATKAALDAVTKILALQLKPYNVAVNAILPGSTFTGQQDPATLSSERRARMLRPETSLPLALFLASQDPLQVTGEIIDVLEWNQTHGFGGQEVWGLVS